MLRAPFSERFTHFEKGCSKDSGLLPAPLGVALSKRVYSPHRGRLLSTIATRWPSPGGPPCASLAINLTQVYPSPFGSQDGSPFGISTCSCTNATVKRL